MEPIQKIDIPNVVIPQFGTNEVWLNGVPFVPSNHPSVTTQIGFPIVEMPGCVKMHQDNKDHVTKMPFDHDLVNQDEKGSTTLCPHGEYPSYDAMDYQPEQLIITREVPPPPVEPPPTPPEFKPDAIPDTKQEEVPCPGPGQLRVGDVTQSGDERVVGHRLLEDGKTCETLYEPTTIVEKFLPPVNQASTVTALAVVATAGAAATPLLIRIIRPVIKKIWTTLQKKFGKNVKQLTRSEIQTNNYREKKGLPPLKRK
tara:strand:- start:384 stop:1151 length:768 start_codon:yes stop_codon:yes gene_type:complete